MNPPTMKMGSTEQDASFGHQVSIFISCSYILILIDAFITYIVSIDEICERENDDNENGFKRHQMCHLDLW